jgi:DNA modification methylase
MIKSQDYLIVKESIPDKIEHGLILNIFTNNVTALTHGFHKYPAKFIPHIPKWAINKYLAEQKSKTIIDPFCGSGTTLVEGMLSGHNVIGIDIDPLSCLIAKVKTTTVNPSELNKVSNWLVKGIKKKKKGEFKPECETIGHWFPKETINKLSIIRTLIDQIPERFGDKKSIRDIQHLLIICFSSVIRRVSFADNESQKTYVSHTYIKTPEEPLNLFLTQLDLFRDRIVKFSENIKPKLRSHIICSSSTESLKTKLRGQNLDLAITSPPYIKAIDYIYNQMAELFWIGDLFDIQTQTKQNEKKKEYIGTKHFHKKDFVKYTPFEITIGIKELDDKIQKVFKTDKKNGHKHAFITFKYFADMENHFAEISKCLNKGRHYIMVVGDSSVSNIFFNTADFLTQIAERNGFRITNKWGYKIKNRYMRFDRNGRGGIIDIDWVLDLVRV